MYKVSRVIQFAGIVFTGIGLIYGIAQNDMRAEFMYLGSGIVIFAIGVILQRR
jgi:hypothetical protein